MTRIMMLLTGGAGWTLYFFLFGVGLWSLLVLAPGYQKVNLDREARFTRRMGWTYLALTVILFVASRVWILIR